MNTFVSYRIRYNIVTLSTETFIADYLISQSMTGDLATRTRTCLDGVALIEFFHKLKKKKRKARYMLILIGLNSVRNH